ncbi:MAG: hypothetical protein COW73_06360 [Nitrospirae bacterium CG18_big_fil_WC_8_21_14_2_50_70_55]|nr:hypothetical protein [Deltaproteobacteria bacterium]OIP65795.1 MAG: hypothetical protein AUK30_03790 [Nitrospirae bacterium CG2_30_70_394]PIQ05241.1 MAG: hypothetical protein COW73_06360 [Nitrospirae bacterium CG18_big_fil_WC_8_21_14_2_50_70_55]PIU80084.1 MAG: hypothetical protein COS73_01130 [Nitrospirae bacterium CG06_land_8_20_14_3_00_70_43]PIW83001.1 MAG: hypothetical protein COZ96_05820 [Nitrospirae bacterium CG_4_8_14_3_um_filter_70_85]PIX83587.1 MAG: hypothetical protein COZ33_04700 
MELSGRCRGLVALLFALFSACGGGGSTDVAGGGIGGTGRSTGPITATNTTVAAASVPGPVTASAVAASTTPLPAITVNSTLFEIPDAAIVTVSGVLADATALRVGQVVIVDFTGDLATGKATAKAITYDSALTAPVAAVDVAGGRVQLLGQWVAVDTLLDADDEDGSPITLANLRPNDLVEISGERDADNVLHATRIERHESNVDPTVQVEGEVANLAADHGSFHLDALTVVPAAGVTLPGTLANGVRVEVEGRLSGATLTVSKVEVKEASPPVEPNLAVELEGFITAVDRLADFNEIEVGGVTVRLTEETTIVGEEDVQADRTNLLRNVEVEVEGTSAAGGVVVAEQIRLDG